MHIQCRYLRNTGYNIIHVREGDAATCLRTSGEEWLCEASSLLDICPRIGRNSILRPNPFSLFAWPSMVKRVMLLLCCCSDGCAESRPLPLFASKLYPLQAATVHRRFARAEQRSNCRSEMDWQIKSTLLYFCRRLSTLLVRCSSSVLLYIPL